VPRVDDLTNERRPSIESFVASDYGRVVGTVALLVGDRHRAEEAVQEAIIKAWTGDHEVRNLRGWVTQVALNQVRSAARRSGAEARAYGRLRPSLATSAPGPVPDRVAVAGALDDLPDRQREVAVLFYYGDLAVAEIAELLSVSEGTVKTQLFRARAALARALGSPDDDLRVDDGEGLER
jgi:RNA polymerase sigma-70 factor (ECF subfamily)